MKAEGQDSECIVATADSSSSKKQGRPSNQNLLLDEAASKGRSITLYLKNGVHYSGKVRAHDSHTILLGTEQGDTLVFKHVITSILNR